MSSLSVQIGTDGITTSYTLRTYAIPPFRTSKLLQDKISDVLLISKANAKDITNLDKIESSKSSPSIIKQSQINAIGKGKLSVSNDQGASLGTSYLYGTINPNGSSEDNGV